VTIDELERAPPRVVGCVLELPLLAVEEAVRRAVVRDDLVLDAVLRERAAERGVVVGGDVLVRARLQREDRAFDGGGARDDARPAPLARRRAVEADGAGEAVTGRRRNPRGAAAEAEADGEDRRDADLAQTLDGRARVGPDVVVREPLDVRRVVEVVVALPGTGGAAEVVDRDRRIPAFREPERELLVEAVQPADVREDDDARFRVAVGRREECGEVGAVGGPERQVVVRDGRARDDGNRRSGIEVEADGAEFTSRTDSSATGRARGGRAARRAARRRRPRATARGTRAPRASRTASGCRARGATSTRARSAR
jgi:hypothetical protein